MLYSQNLFLDKIGGTQDAWAFTLKTSEPEEP